MRERSLRLAMTGPAGDLPGALVASAARPSLPRLFFSRLLFSRLGVVAAALAAIDPRTRRAAAPSPSAEAPFAGPSFTGDGFEAASRYALRAAELAARRRDVTIAADLAGLAAIRGSPPVADAVRPALLYALDAAVASARAGSTVRMTGVAEPGLVRFSMEVAEAPDCDGTALAVARNAAARASGALEVGASRAGRRRVVLRLPVPSDQPTSSNQSASSR